MYRTITCPIGHASSITESNTYIIMLLFINMVRQYNMDKMRRIIGEDDVNSKPTNTRLREAGESSQNEFVRETFNLDVTFDEGVKELINTGGVAYFYKRENGDDKLCVIYTEQIKSYIRTTFGRPKFQTRGKF